MATLKLTTIGNSVGVVFPKEVLAKLRVVKGDTLNIVETPNGIELTAYDADFEKKVEAARSVTKRYRNALKELAK